MNSPTALTCCMLIILLFHNVGMNASVEDNKVTDSEKKVAHQPSYSTFLVSYAEKWHNDRSIIVYSRWDIDILFLILLFIAIYYAIKGYKENKRRGTILYQQMMPVLCEEFASPLINEKNADSDIKNEWKNSSKLTKLSMNSFMMQASGRENVKIFNAAMLCQPRQCIWTMIVNSLLPNTLGDDAFCIEIDIPNLIPMMNFAIIHKKRQKHFYKQQFDLRTFAKRRDHRIIQNSNNHIVVADSQGAVDAVFSKYSLVQTLSALISTQTVQHRSSSLDANNNTASNGIDGSNNVAIENEINTSRICESFSKLSPDTLQCLHVSDIYDVESIENSNCTIMGEFLLNSDALDHRNEGIRAIIKFMLLVADTIPTISISTASSKSVQEVRRLYREELLKAEREEKKESKETIDPEKQRKKLMKQEKKEKSRHMPKIIKV